MPYRDSETQRVYKREWARMKRAGEVVPRGTIVLPVEFRLQTAMDVLVLLAEQVTLVRDDPDVGVLERARCIGYLASVALRAVETADLSSRIDALDAVLRQRGA